MRSTLGTLAAIVTFVLAGMLHAVPARAQIQNPIQAAKDAYNNAKQQSQQKNQSQQTQIASAATPAAPAQSQNSISLEIVGIKPGMAADNAMQALKVDNPRLKLSNVSIQAEGFAKPFIPLVQGDDIAPTNVAEVNQPSETIQVLLTTPPGQAVVWSVWRSYRFPTSRRPSMQATIEALIAKYGPPSTPVDPTNTAQTIVWVYDAQGKPMGPSGRQLNTICEGTLNIYNDGQAFRSDFANPMTTRNWPPQCTSVIIVRANVSGARVSSSTIACDRMEVHLWDGDRYIKGRDATLSVMAAAIKARQNGKANQVNSVAPPKL